MYKLFLLTPIKAHLNSKDDRIVCAILQHASESKIDFKSTSRHNFKMKPDTKLVARRKPLGDVQIIGVRLPSALAREVKSESAKRRTSLRDMFTEMWDLYKQHRPQVDAPVHRPVIPRARAPGETQTIGVRLPIAIAREVKAESAQRQVAIKVMFAEMWPPYKKQKRIR